MFILSGNSVQERGKHLSDWCRCAVCAYLLLLTLVMLTSNIFMNWRAFANVSGGKWASSFSPISQERPRCSHPFSSQIQGIHEEEKWWLFWLRKKTQKFLGAICGKWLTERHKRFTDGWSGWTPWRTSLPSTLSSHQSLEEVTSGFYDNITETMCMSDRRSPGPQGGRWEKVGSQLGLGLCSS